MPLTDEQRQRIQAIDRVLKQVDADLTRVGEFTPEGQRILPIIDGLLSERAQVAPELARLREIDAEIEQAEAVASDSAAQTLTRLQRERDAILTALGPDAPLAEPAPPEPDPPQRLTWIDRFWARLLGGPQASG